MSSITEIIEKIALNDSSITEFKRPKLLLNNSQIESLAIALKNNTHVKYVDVQKTSLSNKTALVFAETIRHNTTITYLDLGYNKIESSGMIAISSALKDNKTLQEIKLHRQDEDMGTKAEMIFVELYDVNTTLRRCYVTLHDRRANQVNTAGEVRNKSIAKRIEDGKEWIDLDPKRRDEYMKQKESIRLAKLESEKLANKPIDSKVQSTGGPYNLKQLTCQKNFLPDDIDLLKKETYLSDEEFLKVFEMDKDTFQKLPKWKQTAKKKQLKLH